jgi:dolichyl-phosphate beta-glucosyltransferase
MDPPVSQASRSGEPAGEDRKRAEPIDLAVVIPAYDEEARIGPTVSRIRDYLEHRALEWQIVVADDGSRDRTVAVVEDVAAGSPRIRIVGLGRNRGKGAAVRAGMLAAIAGGARRVLMSDADLATPIEELAKLERELDGGADIAIGSRALASSEVAVKQHPAREMMGRTFNVLVRALVMNGIKDTQCGFKLFTAASARDLFARARIDGFAFDVEILWLARARYRIVEVPVVWRHVEQSKVSPGRDAMRMLVDILRLRRLHRRGNARRTP